MKIISDKDSNEIECILKNIQNMPYGKDLGHKILSPSANHFATNVDKLIEILHKSVDRENMPTFQQLQSLRDNQVRELIIDSKRNKTFETSGIDYEMECTGSIIQEIVYRFMIYINSE